MTEKLKASESVILSNTYAIAEQIRSNIAALCEEHGVLPVSLPNSAVPTDTLLKLSAGFVLMFNLLQEREMLDIGAAKTNRNIH